MLDLRHFFEQRSRSGGGELEQRCGSRLVAGLQVDAEAAVGVDLTIDPTARARVVGGNQQLDVAWFAAGVVEPSRNGASRALPPAAAAT